MAFMMKKKKYKFQVDFRLDELTEVPFINTVVFAKVRLLDGGFNEISSREEVQHHSVKWGARFCFTCKMCANASTGILEPCILRVSVRKELKGGRSFQKLGFADLNLAEFAGSGCTSKRYLLDGYDTRHRLVNSILSITVHMTLLSGDPCFKASTVQKVAIPGETAEELTLPLDETVEDPSGASVASMASSGFGSLTKNKPQTISTGAADSLGLDLLETPDPVDSGEEVTELPGHSRNSSNTSQMSKGSGYGSMNSQHSRQSSSGDSSHLRNPSVGSGLSETGSMDRLKARKKMEEGKESRMDATRVDPDDLVQEVIELTNLNLEQDESAETSGLQLYIGKDGTTALGGKELKNHITAGSFKPVVMDDR